MKGTKYSPKSYLGQDFGGQYRIERLIGVGGSAWVYRATTAAGWLAAVKVLHTTRATARLRFDREIRVLRVLPQSPYVPRYLSHGWTDDERPYLVLEYVDGVTLKESMKKKPQKARAIAVDLLINLCRAFAGLHELGVAHRDVKPANVLLPLRGGVALIDFGLVRDAQGLLQLFEEVDPMQNPIFNYEIDQWLLAGTPEYMAPEQFADALSDDGSPGTTDTWSDVYSLGVILYELLSGRKPFPMKESSPRRTSETYLRYARWRRSLTDNDIPPCPGVDEPLESILRRALCSDPRRRPRDARQFEAELQRYVNSGLGIEEEESLTLPIAASEMTRETTDKLLPLSSYQSVSERDRTEETVTPIRSTKGRASARDDDTTPGNYQFFDDTDSPTLRDSSESSGLPPQDHVDFDSRRMAHENGDIKTELELKIPLSPKKPNRAE